MYESVEAGDGGGGCMLQAGADVIEYRRGIDPPGGNAIDVEGRMGAAGARAAGVDGYIPAHRVQLGYVPCPTAKQALALVCTGSNDVSGLRDVKMAEMVADTDCIYVLMHALSVPASKISFYPRCGPVAECCGLRSKKLGSAGGLWCGATRVIFRPGDWIWKSAAQSLHAFKTCAALQSLWPAALDRSFAQILL